MGRKGFRLVIQVIVDIDISFSIMQSIALKIYTEGDIMDKRISQEELKHLLQYNPETGHFYWKRPRAPRMSEMDIAGTLTPKGSRQIMIFRKAYRAHVLAFFYIKGFWPEYRIIHKNGNPDDNRWSNLEYCDYDKYKEKLDYETLREILHYDPITGKFHWIKTLSNRSPVGSECTRLSKGYVSIRIGNRNYQAHRLAWLYMEGYWPEHEIDHINRDRADNRWCNLRHVTHRCNSTNIPVKSNNKTGITGVSLHATGYVVKIAKEYVGFYKSFTVAVKARWEAEVRYGFKNCQTTSSAYLYLKDKGLI